MRSSRLFICLPLNVLAVSTSELPQLFYCGQTRVRPRNEVPKSIFSYVQGILLLRRINILLCSSVSMFVCYASHTRCFASRAPNIQGFIYDPTVGLSQFYFFEIHPAITLSTNNTELPFVVITYICPQRYSNNYVQLLTTSCVVS